MSDREHSSATLASTSPYERGFQIAAMLIAGGILFGGLMCAGVASAAGPGSGALAVLGLAFLIGGPLLGTVLIIGLVIGLVIKSLIRHTNGPQP